MKKQFLFAFAILTTFFASAQTDSSKLPAYKRFPTLPPVTLLLTDSASHFSKGNFSKKEQVLIILFNPECEHCQKETEELLDSIDHFKNIQIVMATMMPFSEMTAFYKKYKLAKYHNIVVGQDTKYFLPVFYMVSNLPYLALYNKKGELITTFEGAVPIHKVIGEFNK
ncbi:MAG: thioredoxin [Bacteroidetes bacterium]|nr:thioredoxin [Bacteroidota bacterium]MBS1930627.1 thioredoxin [Bacteroidota bacterium]